MRFNQIGDPISTTTSLAAGSHTGESRLTSFISAVFARHERRLLRRSKVKSNWALNRRSVELVLRHGAAPPVRAPDHLVVCFRTLVGWLRMRAVMQADDGTHRRCRPWAPADSMLLYLFPGAA